MNSDEIKTLVRKSENAAVEFKRARGGVPADFWTSYSAFANTDGGTIVLGVREKDGRREIEGVGDAEKTVAVREPRFIYDCGGETLSYEEIEDWLVALIKESCGDAVEILEG